LSDSRWQKIEQIFQTAVELAPEARPAYLSQACAADQSLRQEVEVLLAHESEDGNTFLGPPEDAAPQSIAHYRITGKLGEGGMGVVYRAIDTKLGRDVAIKVLPAQFADDAGMMARFQREAELLASLNHPNIAAIYGVEARALIMELVEGRNLSGPLPLETALDYASQIAGALDGAHEKGIVHRDLKPANIRITPDGVVKVLDFGLAKPASPRAGSEHSTTVTQVTQAGTIMGTAAYMAPEQARGQIVDKRADIWAFGAVLFEMLSGKRAFGGATVSDSLAAVLAREPDFSALPPATPPHVRRLIERCLCKNPKLRLRDIGDVGILLDQVQPGAPASTHRWIPWTVAGVLGLLLLAVGGLWLHRLSAAFNKGAPDEHATRFLLPLPEKAAFGTYDQPVLSPDGKRIVFSARNEKGGFFVHSLDTLETRHFPGSEDFTSPFWSPDSRFVAFHGSGELKKIDLQSGAVTAICETGLGYGGVWNQDGVILFGSNRGVMRVSAVGGKPVPVTRFDNGKGEIFHSWPSFLPDGDHFLYTVSASVAENRGTYIGSLGSDAPHRILPDATNAQYSPLGYLVFNRANDLLAQRFDGTRLELSGEPSVIAQGVATVSNFSWAVFSTAGSSLVYRVGSGLSVVQMEWRDRNGNKLGTVGPAGDFSNPAVSPDGRTLAVSRRDPATKTRDIWLFDLARGTDRRFTFDPADDSSPAFSPDSQRIMFTSNRKGHRDIWQKAVSGPSGEEVVLESSDAEKPVDDWTRDGRYLIFGRLVAGLKREEWALPLFGDHKPFAVIRGPGFIWGAQVSPNGKWIAYDSDESGRREIYVQNFPPAGGRWQISTDGGVEPSWSPDGKELFYLHLDKLMALDVNSLDRFESGTPHPLFEAPFGNHGRSAYAIASDGKKFLVNIRAEATDSLPMTVVLNWPAAVKR
jgi:Tol biopolymer transport system component